ncbi:type IV secretory system conjugative DNA transfer family protein [bacterium]|nr:type IV secretory system conjugative DNA transfer family protein [bacterium]
MGSKKKTYTIFLAHEELSDAVGHWIAIQKITKAGQMMESLQIVWEQVSDTFALEVYCHRQHIELCITASEEDIGQIASALYTTVPSAEITERSDFTELVSEHDIVVGQEYHCAEPRFPSLPFLNFEDRQLDCMGPMLNIISVLPPDHHYIFQFVAKKVPDTWRINMRYRMESIFWHTNFPFRPIFWFKPGVREKYQESYSQKIIKPAFRVCARTAVVVPASAEISEEERKEREALAKKNLRSMVAGLQFMSRSDLGRFKKGKVRSGIKALRPVHQRALKKPYFMSLAELSTLWHPVFVHQQMNIAQILAEHGSPPSALLSTRSEGESSLFGKTNFRKGGSSFGIKRADREGHLHILGKSGTGKSKLIELLVQSDMQQGYGLALLDCHGDLVDEVLRLVPEERVQDVALFDVSDSHYPPSFNPFSQVLQSERQFLAAEFIDMFKRVEGADLSESAERVLQNVVLALMETPGSNVLSMFQMLTDGGFRADIIEKLPEGAVKDFWQKEMEVGKNLLDQPDIFRLTKVISKLVSTNLVSCILGQVENSFDFSRMIEEGKIILLKIPKKNLGKQNTVLLGTLVLTMIRLAASARAERGTADKPFYIYVDEFQNFATESFSKSLTHAAKHKVSYTIAHQMVNQLPDSVREVLKSKVSNTLSFQLGSDDAAALEGRFSPPFNRLGLMNLDLRNFYIRMAIDGDSQEAFSGSTIDVVFPEHDFAEQCRENSRRQYTRIREEVLENLLLSGGSTS